MDKASVEINSNYAEIGSRLTDQMNTGKFQGTEYENKLVFFNKKGCDYSSSENLEGKFVYFKPKSTEKEIYSCDFEEIYHFDKEGKLLNSFIGSDDENEVRNELFIKMRK